MILGIAAKHCAEKPFSAQRQQMILGTAVARSVGGRPLVDQPWVGIMSCRWGLAGRQATVKLGIMSDSHGRVALVRAALGLLDEAGAEGIVHCGDVGGLAVLEELAGRRCWFVWGNADLPGPGWRAEVQALGLPWPQGPLTLELAGKRIAVYHGHEPGFAQVLQAAEHDYLLRGHTHQREDHRVGRMRVINPGALRRGWTKSVALLDLDSDLLRFMDV